MEKPRSTNFVAVWVMADNGKLSQVSIGQGCRDVFFCSWKWRGKLWSRGEGTEFCDFVLVQCL